MSYVTSYILTFTIEEPERVAELNSLLLAEKLYANFVRVDQHAGGNKYMQVEVYLAASGNTRLEEMAAMMQRVEWECPDAVQLFVRDEHDERVTEFDWRAAGGKGE